MMFFKILGGGLDMISLKEYAALTKKKWQKLNNFLKNLIVALLCTLFSVFYFGFLGTSLQTMFDKDRLPFFWTGTSLPIILLLTFLVIHHKKELEKALKNSNIDPRTNLYNDRFIPEAINIVFSYALRNSLTKEKVFFCCALLDINDFKKINDAYGYKTGNMALRNAAKKIKELIRGVDIAIRYGGDELMVIFASSKPASILWKIYTVFEKEGVTFFSEDLDEIKVTASIGYGRTLIRKDGRQNKFELYEQIFADANVALKKRKKKKGINR